MSAEASRPGADPASLARAGSLLASAGTIAVGIGALVTLIWGLTGGYFWPVWVWFALAIALGCFASWWHALHFAGRRRWLVMHLDLNVVACLIVLAVWLLSDGGFFWPAIPMVALLGIFGCHAVVSENWDRLSGGARERELSARVDQLTRSRKGALEAQAAQLRQVERDMHDGAQSRLVALSMQLGRAEARLSDRPDEQALVREARQEATEAIAELRDLARGIAPPVLADRGLAEAARSLGSRVPAGVTVESKIESRPPPVVETAAYFVIAESLTNSAKHAPESPVTVGIDASDGRLSIRVRDSGPGGADSRGNGLAGLRHRVEALDGRIGIDSPPGGGTAIRVDLPCE